MGKRKTQDEIIQGFIEKHGNKYDYSKVLYIDSSTEVIIICPIHGEFKKTPNKHKTGRGCTDCTKIEAIKNRTRSKEDVIAQALIVHNNFYSYENIGVYTKTKDVHIITCPIHGDFPQTFDNHLSGKGCTHCGRKRTTDTTRLSREEAIEGFRNVHGDLYNYDKVDYISSSKDIIITCKKHGDFPQKANNHMSGAGCTKCNPMTSKTELEIYNFIKDNTTITVNQGVRNILKNGKELDIVIPSLNIAIEFDGLYWHSDKYLNTSYHLDKTKSCNEVGYRLIHIFEDEWINKKEIVKSRILNVLNLSFNKIYARKTTIREVNSKEATKFLEENHIQGKIGAKIRLGLYYNGDLVSLMIFGSLRKNLGSKSKEGDWELLRFCNKLNTSVVGGASKLLKYFEENYKPSSLISYADRRWSEGQLYNKLNFTFLAETPSNYFYISGYKRLNRFNFRKDILVSKGFDKNKTEKEITKELGYNRIYDCGSLKFKKVYL